MADADASRRAFRALHQSGTFVLPNAWDQGSARLARELQDSGTSTYLDHALAASLRDAAFPPDPPA